MTIEYLVPAKTIKTEYEIKKSRFISHAKRVVDRDDAMRFLQEIKNQYSDARHHCWAYLLGNPISPRSAAFSDDGEPNGTAGKPILNVLQHKNVGEIMLIVVRYFGGIKLGAGGLVRAYSASAQMTMAELSTENKVMLCEQTVIGDYALEQALRHWLTTHSGEVSEVRYREETEVDIKIRDEDIIFLENYALGLGARLCK